jgi:beta-lactamase class A
MRKTTSSIFCIFISLTLAGLTPLAGGADMESLKKALEDEIRASGAEVSVAFKNLETPESLLIREKEMVHAASTMKVPVMIEVFKQAEDGRFRLDNRLVVKNEFRSLVDGSLFSLRKEDDSDVDIYGLVDTEMTIRELVDRMITVSSNLATNILVDLVQAKNVMTTLRELGVRRMKVRRGVEDALAYERGLNNMTDALDLMKVMEAIASGKAGSPPACEEMIAILERQKFRSGIPAGVPSGVPVANKTGSITGMEHDAAIVYPPGQNPYVLVILARRIKSSEEGEKLIARLSRLVYEEATRPGLARLTKSQTSGILNKN